MDILEWIDKQIESSIYHPDYKHIYLSIIKDYEAQNGKAEIKELDSGGDQETGSIAQTDGNTGKQADPGRKAKPGRKKGWKVRTKGKVGKDAKENEIIK